MDDKVPICMKDAARKVRQLNIDGSMVAISKLELVIEQVKGLNLNNIDKIKNELIKRVKIYNYVPPPVEDAYAEALFQEFKNVVNQD
jgi:hypothetical protein